MLTYNQENAHTMNFKKQHLMFYIRMKRIKLIKNHLTELCKLVKSTGFATFVYQGNIHKIKYLKRGLLHSAHYIHKCKVHRNDQYS